MSADNWAVCPRCLHEDKAELAKRQAYVREQYGKVSIEEWDDLSKVLTEEVDAEKFRTFREDYEFWGAETGRLLIEYSGECQVCKLTVTHEDAKTFWELST